MTTTNPNPPEEAPTIWIAPNEVFRWIVPSQGGQDIEYVPASRVSEVWDEAIRVLMKAAEECPVFVYHSAQGRDFLMDALKAAKEKQC